LIDFTKRNLLFSFLGLIVIGIVTALAFAGKPEVGGIYSGNGYPSGPHYNLNLIGKKDNFTCPAPKFQIIKPGSTELSPGDIVEGSCPGDATCEQIFGNVIFMPRNENGAADPISITIESGRKGPKSKPGATVLEVTDWCTQSFPDDGSSPPPWGDGATLRLPYNEYGYAVYARILGKPAEGGDPTFEFTSRTLTLVEDEFGNDLWMLGLVTSQGLFTSTGDLLKRFDSGKKGKGAKKAVEITDLFMFDGEVCFINDASIDLFCEEDVDQDNCALRTDPVNGGINFPVCCAAANLENGDVVLADSCDTVDADGYAFCQDASLVEGPDNTIGDDLNKIGDGNCDPGETCTYVCDFSIEIEDPTNAFGNDPSLIGDGNCDPGETCITVPDQEGEICEVVPVCKDFSSNPVWIFNIEAFVNVLFGVENNGSYIVKLRFYPLPLN